MHKMDVRTVGQAMAYLLDCAMATVESMAMTKSRKKGEYARQIAIAQTHYDWCRQFGVSVDTTRASDLPKHDHCIRSWAEAFEV